MQFAGFVLTVAACGLAAALAADDNDWPSHDRDAGGQRFSPLKQITPANVARLQPAWTFDTGATGIQVTPLVVGGHHVRHRRQGHRRARAGDGEGASGSTPRRPRSASAASPTGRAIAIRRRGCSAAPAIGCSPSTRSAGSRRPASARTARVDLKASVRGDVDGGFSLASPPAVYKNIVITGGNNGEQAPELRARTATSAAGTRTRGKLLWSFHTVPRAGEPGVETWEGESWKNRSGTNVWSFFTDRRRARARLRAARVADLRLLRRRSQGREPVRQLDRRARRDAPAS